MDVEYLKQKAIHIAATLLSVGLVLYVCYHMFYGFTQRVETQPASISEVDIRISGDAYIFRDESPLTAVVEGAFVPVADDGERVGVGDILCRIYDGATPDQLARLEEIDSRLDVIEEMQSRRLSVRDTASVDADIYATLAQIASQGTSGDVAALSAERASLGASLSRRSLLIGQMNASDVAEALRQERASLTASFGKCLKEVTAQASGYFYSRCDGYESIFTADAAMSVSPSGFMELTKRAPDEQGGHGKLAHSYTWYLGMLTKEISASEMKVGRQYPVSFTQSGSAEYEMTLVRCEEDAAGTLLIFSSGRLSSDVERTRSQAVRVVMRSYSGIRIPASALRVSEEGISGVYILAGGVVSFRAVSILTEGEDWVLLDPAPSGELPEKMQWLRTSDMIITQGRGLSEGRILS